MSPSTLIACWFPQSKLVSYSRCPGGLSGAQVWKVVLESGDDSALPDCRAFAPAPTGGTTSGATSWALRRWPQGTTATRVEQVHSVLAYAHAARQSSWKIDPQRAQTGIDHEVPSSSALECSNGPQIGLPSLRTVVPATLSFVAGANICAVSNTAILHDGFLWECCQWMPGSKPHFSSNPLAIVRESITAVARFHQSVANLGSLQNRNPLAIRSRLARVQHLDDTWGDSVNSSRIEPTIFGNVGSGAASAGSVTKHFEYSFDVFRSQWSVGRDRVMRCLSQLQSDSFQQSYVLRDIHCGNTLFDRDRLTGLIDFDAVQIDSPAADIARLIGSWQLETTSEQWSSIASQVWEESLAVYRSIRPFSDRDERLARVLFAVNPMIHLANWANWLVFEPWRFTGRESDAVARMYDWAQVVQGAHWGLGLS